MQRVAQMGDDPPRVGSLWRVNNRVVIHGSGSQAEVVKTGSYITVLRNIDSSRVEVMASTGCVGYALMVYFYPPNDTDSRSLKLVSD